MINARSLQFIIKQHGANFFRHNYTLGYGSQEINITVLLKEVELNIQLSRSTKSYTYTGLY